MNSLRQSEQLKKIVAREKLRFYFEQQEHSQHLQQSHIDRLYINFVSFSYDRGLNGQMVLVLNKLSYKATLIGLYNDEITSQTSYDCELYQKLDD